MPDLTEMLQRLRDKLKNVHDKAKDVGDGGTPTERDKAQVDGWTADAEADIDVILDPQQSPSLVPPGAGSAQTVTIPSSRLQTCQDALDLAEDAFNEMSGQNPDYATIGDDLRTIKASYLDAIRQKFGVD